MFADVRRRPMLGHLDRSADDLDLLKNVRRHSRLDQTAAAIGARVEPVQKSPVDFIRGERESIMSFVSRLRADLPDSRVRLRLRRLDNIARRRLRGILLVFRKLVFETPYAFSLSFDNLVLLDKPRFNPCHELLKGYNSLAQPFAVRTMFVAHGNNNNTS